MESRAEEKKPGRILCKKRRERGYSRAYVAERLNLRPEAIRQIEEDDHPGDSVFAGFVRSYASMLGVEIKHRPKVKPPRRRQPRGLPLKEGEGGFSLLAKVMALILLALAYMGWDDYTVGGDLVADESEFLGMTDD